MVINSVSHVRGQVEILSTVFAHGWVEVHAGYPAYVFALLDSQIIGVSEADQVRPDLQEAGAAESFIGRAFTILFNRPVPADRVAEVVVRDAAKNQVIAQYAQVRLDRTPIRQVFILGSPRSGTSELAATLAAQLELPWLGEGHAGPLFATAARLLEGDSASPDTMVRFMADQQFRRFAIDRARLAYYTTHGSASFVDKTPGVPMIIAVPFLHECFPDAKFIYLRRNGISNVLSRMAKFGGDFQEHCEDWAAAMDRWLEASLELPHFLEIRQEDMLALPGETGGKIADYLGVPDKAKAIGESLSLGQHERTGAGLGHETLDDTGWTTEQISHFTRICGPAMERSRYSLDCSD